MLENKIVLRTKDMMNIIKSMLEFNKQIAFQINEKELIVRGFNTDKTAMLKIKTKVDSGIKEKDYILDYDNIKKFLNITFGESIEVEFKEENKSKVKILKDGKSIKSFTAKYKEDKEAMKTEPKKMGENQISINKGLFIETLRDIKTTAKLMQIELNEKNELCMRSIDSTNTVEITFEDNKEIKIDKKNELFEKSIYSIELLEKIATFPLTDLNVCIGSNTLMRVWGVDSETETEYNFYIAPRIEQ